MTNAVYHATNALAHLQQVVVAYETVDEARDLAEDNLMVDEVAVAKADLIVARATRLAKEHSTAAFVCLSKIEHETSDIAIALHEFEVKLATGGN